MCSHLTWLPNAFFTLSKTYSKESESAWLGESTFFPEKLSRVSWTASPGSFAYPAASGIVLSAYTSGENLFWQVMTPNTTGQPNPSRLQSLISIRQY